MPLPSRIPLVVEEKHDLPLARLVVTLKHGAAEDPANAEGMACFASELTRRGAGGLSRTDIDERLDRLGGDLWISAGHDAVSYELEFLSRHLEEAVELLATLLERADFSEAEAEQLRRETMANLDELEEDDPQLARRFFQRQLFEGHPYGRTLIGTRRSLARLTGARARRWLERSLSADGLILGAAGDLAADAVRTLFGRHFAVLRSQGAPALALPDVPPPPRSLLLVDKPGRTQSQILVGQPTIRWAHPDFLALAVAANAFGGSFTARLMNEIRSKRGLSYGASARLGQGRGGRALQAYVFPASERTGETLGLVLDLWRTWVEEGLSDDEVRFAQKHLAGSFVLGLVTPEERLDYRVAMALCGLPEDYLETAPARMRALTPEDVRAAMQRHLTAQPPAITVLATAKDVRRQLEELDWGEIEIIAYDRF